LPSLLQTIHKLPARFFYFKFKTYYLYIAVVVGACEFVNKSLKLSKRTT